MIGQLSVGYRFRVVGADGVYGEELHPIRGATLSQDTTSTISRQVQGLTLAPDETHLFNPMSDRILISMVTGGEEWPLGRYVATDVVYPTQSGILPLTLADEMFVVDQPMTDSFAAGGILVSEAIRALVEDLPIGEPRIDPCSEVSSASWAAGTSRASVLKDLCSAGGYFAPVFDNAGTLRCIHAFDPSESVPTFDFDVEGSVLRGSGTITDSALSSPNRFVVVSNDTDELPIVGIYDVPSAAPNSILNRGFVIADVRDAQISTSDQAQVYARAIGLQELIIQKAEVDTAPDPRHDVYDVVTVYGSRWLEIGWSLSLSAGGTMRHTLSRSYPVSGEES